jgi:hypothetical protein
MDITPLNPQPEEPNLPTAEPSPPTVIQPSEPAVVGDTPPTEQPVIITPQATDQGAAVSPAADPVVAPLSPVPPIPPAPTEMPTFSPQFITPTVTPVSPISANEVITPSIPSVISTPTVTPLPMLSGEVPSQPVAVPVMGSSGGDGPKRRRFVKPLLASLAVLLIVGGGAAAAYVGVIVPNKPANVLKTALLNSLQQSQVSFTGSVAGSSSGLSYKVAVNGAENTAAKASDVQLNVTVSGITFPIEARLVNQNIYVKIGDLGTITSLINGFDPSAASLTQSVSSQISNKWILIDSTLVNEAGLSCVLNTSLSLTKADTNILATQFVKQPFAVINTSAGDTLNGQKVEKYNVTIDDNKLAAYSKGLGSLSVVKALSDCQKSGSSASSSADSAVTSVLADGQKTPLTIWVNKSTKRIVQIGAQSTTGTGQDASQVSGVLDFTYNKVSITAPANAEPALQLIASLSSSLQASGIDTSDLLSGLGGLTTGGQTDAKDAKRQTDIQALQTQIEAFFSRNGYYPSLTDMNSASWRATNMPSLDANSMQDPDGSAETLAAKPATNVYSYQVSSSSGVSCESDDTTCAQYTLTATLSDGSAYSLSNLD